MSGQRNFLAADIAAAKENLVICGLCGRRKRRDCDGKGTLEALGPYRDGSYISSRECPNENPFAMD